MEQSWMKYRKLLQDQVEEAQYNVEHAETILKQARAKLNVAERGLEQFTILLEEKLDQIEKETKE